MAESSFYHVSQKGQLVRFATLTEGLAAAKSGGFIWLDYCEPTKEDLSVLTDSLGIP